MEKDGARSHGGRSLPKTAGSTARSQIASDQSPPRRTTGYVHFNTAGSVSDPCSVPRSLPLVSRSFDTTTVEGSSSRVWQTSYDHLPTTLQLHYSLFPRDERLPRSVAYGHSLNYPRDAVETDGSDDVKTDSPSGAPPAGLRTKIHGPRQSTHDQEENSLPTRQTNLAPPKRCGLDTRLGSEESRPLASSHVFDLSRAPTAMSTRSKPSADTAAALESGSCMTQEEHRTAGHDTEVVLAPLCVSELGEHPYGNSSATQDFAQHLAGLLGDGGDHLARTDTDSIVGRRSPSKYSKQSGEASLELRSDQDFTPRQRHEKPALILLDSQLRGCPKERTMPMDDSRTDCSVPWVATGRPGLHVRWTSTGSASTDASDSTTSESAPSDSENEPLNMAITLLMRQLITCLLAGWLWNSIILDVHTLPKNFRSCPLGNAVPPGSTSTGKKRSMVSPHRNNTSSSHEEDDEEDGGESDDQSRRPRRKIRKADDSSPSSPRILACPFHKMDPLRFSVLNEREKLYRKCPSAYLPSIPRLKQHLNRAHRQPKFCCPSCQMTFENQSRLNDHLVQRPACEFLEERRFDEKMSDEQMTEINKKHPGLSTRKCWNLIFSILFPGETVPDSPYIATSERELVKNLKDHFCREAPRILSLLLQSHLQPALPAGPMDSHRLDSICQWSTQQCVALVIDLLAPRSRSTLRYPNTNPLLERNSDEAGLLFPQSLTQPEVVHAPAQTEMNDPVVEIQDRCASSVYSPLYQPTGSIETQSSSGNVGPASLSGPDYRQFLLSEQPDAVDTEILWHDQFVLLSDFVGQNVPWNNSPIASYAGPDYDCP